ncbi:MAG: right-handed parallel beta-helix repeat-containing protein [Thermoplasmata archaeon]|nr:right-handed parallel beta-helix repeat-containing protein [Thermoplasmata archaeon]
MKRTNLVVAVLVFVSVLFVGLSFLPEARATTRYVGGTDSGNYTTIQGAIDDANPGDTIYVYSGTYYEHVVVSKSLILVGEDRSTTVIDGEEKSWPSGHVVEVTAEKVSISGFTIQNISNWSPSGEPVVGPSSILLNSVSGCNITDNALIDIHWLGLALYNSSGNILSNNIIARPHNGGSGIYLDGSSDNMVRDNMITNASHGISLHRSSNGNTITNNSISLAEGFSIVIYSSDNIVTENIITNGYRGIWLRVCSTDNTIYHNSFINNTFQADIEPHLFNNTWDNGYPSGGNYWNNYIGVDVKSGPNQDEPGSDGIGATPYVIDADNRDRYPLMKPELSQVGVKVGDWIEYDYTVTGETYGTLYPTWEKLEFIGAEGTVRITTHLSDGTERDQTKTVNVMAYIHTLGPFQRFVIPANCTTGDSIYKSEYVNITIDGETTRTYAGASRTVVYASFLSYRAQFTHYWDKQTGIMVEASMTVPEMTVTAKATETNMWGAPSPTLWMQWWLWAIVAVGIVALAGAVYFLRKRKPPIAPPLPPEGSL